MEGINVVGVTYDPVAHQRKFVGKHKISFPVMSDIDSIVIQQLGILNTDMPRETQYYGVPYPGIYLLDADSRVNAKFAEEDYRDRPLLKDVMDAAGKLAAVDLADKPATNDADF